MQIVLSTLKGYLTITRGFYEKVFGSVSVSGLKYIVLEICIFVA